MCAAPNLQQSFQYKKLLFFYIFVLYTCAHEYMGRIFKVHDFTKSCWDDTGQHLEALTLVSPNTVSMKEGTQE